MELQTKRKPPKGNFWGVKRKREAPKVEGRLLNLDRTICGS